MENSFRRLWSRKKSWGSVDQPSAQRKMSISNETGSQPQSTGSALKDGRPSMTSVRQVPDRPYSRDKFGVARDIMTPTGDDLSRVKSNHRIQPMLVGISRPETANARDRPGTSGSFQSAVQRAADAAGGRPSDAADTQPTITRSNQSYKPPSRHVDIFSIGTAMPSNYSLYNEDIAERNLDTLRLALENTPYVYDPSSKYQEEVAIRNAYLPYKTRPSTDTLRKSFDHDRTASMTSRSARSVVSPRPNGLHSQQPSFDLTIPAQTGAADPVSHHSRQWSQRSKDGKQLPAIPQEGVDEPQPPTDDGLRISVQIPYSPTRMTGQSPVLREARMSTIAEGLPYETRPSTASQTPASRDSGHGSTIGFSDYKISAAEAALGPSSRNSAGSSVRKQITLSNRTILDLTSDEPELLSETSSAAGYSQYSPVLEQAKSDAFQRILPSQIHTEERRSSKGPSHFMMDLDTPTATSRNQTLFVPDSTPPAATFVITDTDTDTDPTPTAAVPSLVQRLPWSAFSPISTVASWSPRSSAYITSPSEATSMTARVAAALEAAKSIAKDEPLQAPTRTGNVTPTVRERVASLENHVERSTSSPISVLEGNSNANQLKPPSPSPPSVSIAQPSTSAALPSTSIDLPSTPITQPPASTPQLPASTPASTDPRPKAPTPASQALSTNLPTNEIMYRSSAPISRALATFSQSPGPAPQSPTSTAQTPAKSIIPNVEKNAIVTPSAKPAKKVTDTPSIYQPPQSIPSADLIDPSHAFGVRTRDFALSPRKTAVPTRQEGTPKTSTLSPTPSTGKKVDQRPKSSKSRAKQATPANSKPKETGFDEEAFKRKQAEARAALERLQRSLSEDFLILPDRDSVKNSKGKEPEAENRMPGVVLPQDPKVTVVSPTTSKRDSTERGPPSSFRNSRGEQQQRTSYASSRSLSTGSRSSRRAPAPSTLKNIEPANIPIDQTVLGPALLQAMQLTGNPPKSPGEISLSSFPVPSSSRPPSQPDAPAGYHSHTNSLVTAMKRRGSTKSQGSTASAFSIPYHMVPGRTSSVRDPVPEEVDPIWA